LSFETLRKLQEYDGNSTLDNFIFCDFNGRLLAKNGRLLAKNPQATSPLSKTIKFDQYMRSLFIWYGNILGLSPEEFRIQCFNMALNRVALVVFQQFQIASILVEL